MLFRINRFMSQTRVGSCSPSQLRQRVFPTLPVTVSATAVQSEPPLRTAACDGAPMWTLTWEFHRVLMPQILLF